MELPVRRIGSYGAAILALALLSGLAAAMERRPVYNIAHMVNSIAKFDEAMEGGANSVEADVTFADNGTVTRLFHGVPCDCFRACDIQEEVPPFLQYVRRTTSGNRRKYSQKLALLFLDLKVGNVEEESKYRAGVDIAEKLLRHLWDGVVPWQMMKVLLSVPSVSDKKVLEGAIQIISRLNPVALDKIGFDISNNDKLDTIREMYRDLGIDGHRWQGDGISNCLSLLRPAARLQSVIDNRDSEEPDGYVEKAYQWTVDLPKQLRRSLRRGVDGIITNRPARMARIMEEDEFKNTLRPANVSDSPWIRFGAPSPFPRLPSTDMDFLGDDDFDALRGLNF
ncbi:hypothetical protein V5799_023256 [Amblyomma americanum]|uniref:Uncharacterized protein n=1 Tax=Amblyomma americanum TaxID=6943 RepID=A0AAQ4FI66_AMBAM